MLSRTLTLVVTVFLVVGIGGWLLGMPKPADPVPYVFAPVATTQIEGQARNPIDPGTTVVSSAAGVRPLLDGAVLSATDGVVSTEWLLRTGSATGIPVRVLQAYAVGATTAEKRAPDCRLGWNTLAAIGQVESGHGTHDGAHIDDSGALVGSLLGPRLDGIRFAEIQDTDAGKWDGDTVFDRAVGPMQFVPETWSAYGEDGSGDGIADPNQIDDAALSAAIYLCTAGGDLSTDAGWTAAIHAYNHDALYVENVRTQANTYSAVTAQ